MHLRVEWGVEHRQRTGIANSRDFDNVANLAWTVCRLVTETVERMTVHLEIIYPLWLNL